MTTAIATRPASLLMDVEAFNHMQRVGKMLALSPLFPEHLRKGGIDVAIANGVLVMNMASRLQEDPLTVAQNIYFVGGKPGWSAIYMIGKANQHSVFRDTIDWEISGQGDTLSVTAFAVLASTGKRVSTVCDFAMAKAEGWTKNAKYQSMPEQMLRYRSATFLIRLYCPEVMMGLPTTTELETGMKDVTPDDEPQFIQARAESAVEAKVVDEAETKPAAKAIKPRADSGAYAEGAPKAGKQTDAPQAAEVKPEPLQEQGNMFEGDQQAKPSHDFSENSWGKSFLTDVTDMGFDQAYDLHESHFNAVKDEHPDFHTWLMERVAEIGA